VVKGQLPSVVIPNERAIDHRRVQLGAAAPREDAIDNDAAPVTELDYLEIPDLEALHGRAACIASSASSRLKVPDGKAMTAFALRVLSRVGATVAGHQRPPALMFQSAQLLCKIHCATPRS
jgi:hypothetical protein